MSDPKPSAVGVGSMEMTLRELLLHMMDQNLDHVVLVVPGLPIRVTVTVGTDEAQIAELTRQVQRILTP